MTIKSIIKANSKGRGTDTMWKTVDMLSDYLEEHPGEEACYQKLLKELYHEMCGGHFDEEFGREQISKMYYVDQLGKTHYGPYWTDSEMQDVWDQVRTALPDDVTEWDFYVTLNMIKSDYVNLLYSWREDATEEEIDKMIVEMAVTYLIDPDAPHGNEKIWHYFQ